MSISRAVLTLLASVLTVAAASAGPSSRCVSISIPSFNILPDDTCSITDAELVEWKLPDQEFLADLNILPPGESCFVIVDPDALLPPDEWETSVEGELIDEQTGRVLSIMVSGVAGLTLNAYPVSADPSEPRSFTAASVLTIQAEDEYIGQLVTRDAGTLFPDGNVAARLSIAAGTHRLRNLAGYVDEFGQEFNPLDPASALGRLCGKKLGERLFDDD